jgi:hypothetical protein
MAEKGQHMDKLFKEASKQFASPAPEAVWNRLESQLAKRRRRKAIWWWIWGTGMLGVLLAGWLLLPLDFTQNNTLSSEHPKEQKVITNSLETNSKETIIESQENLTSNQQANQATKSSENQLSKVVDKSHKNPTFEQNSSTFADNIPDNPAPVISSASMDELKKDAKEKSSNKLRDSDIESGAEENDSKNKDIPTFKQLTEKDWVDSSSQVSELSDSLNQTLITETSVQDSLTKNPIEPPLSPGEEKPAAKERNKPRFFVSYHMGFGMSGGFYAQAEESVPFTAISNDAKAQYERGISVSGGAFVGKWILSMGISTFDLKTQSNYHLDAKYLKYIKVDYFGLSPLGYYSIDNIENVLQSKNYGSVDYLRNFDQTRFHVSMTHLTFSIGRSWNWNKWNLYVRIGLQSTSINSSSVEARDENGYVPLGHVHDLKANLLGVSLSTDMLYPLGDHWLMGLQFNVQQSLSNISSHADVRYYPYGWYLGPQIMYKF